MTTANPPPDPDRLDELWPPCGPCGFCGGPDKRHRMWDMLRLRHEAGESVAFIAWDYGRTVEEVRAGIAMGKVDKATRKSRFRRLRRASLDRRGYR